MALPSSATALPTSGTHPVKLSSSFLRSLENENGREDDTGLVAFKYKFKPSSITHASAGTLFPSSSSNGEQILAMQHAATEEQAAFRVKAEPAKKLDCVLIWDEEAETFTLHPLSTTLNLTLDRNLVPPAAPTLPHASESAGADSPEPNPEFDYVETVSPPSPPAATDALDEGDDELERQLQAQLEQEANAPDEDVLQPEAEPDLDVNLEMVEAPMVPVPLEASRPSESPPVRTLSPVATLSAPLKRLPTPEVSVFQPKKKKRPSAINTSGQAAGGGTRGAQAREMAAKAWGKTAIPVQQDSEEAPEPDADAEEDDLDDFAAMMEESLAQPTPVKPAGKGRGGARGGRGSRGGRGRGAKARGGAAAVIEREDSPEFVQVAVPQPAQPSQPQSAKSLTAMMGLPEDDDDSSDESSDDD